MKILKAKPPRKTASEFKHSPLVSQRTIGGDLKLLLSKADRSLWTDHHCLPEGSSKRPRAKSPQNKRTSRTNEPPEQTNPQNKRTQSTGTTSGETTDLRISFRPRAFRLPWFVMTSRGQPEAPPKSPDCRTKGVRFVEDFSGNQESGESTQRLNSEIEPKGHFRLTTSLKRLNLEEAPSPGKEPSADQCHSID